MTWRVPRRLIFECGSGSREESLFVDSRVTGLFNEYEVSGREGREIEEREREAYLVESHEFDSVVRVLLNDSGSVFISVERVHEDERNVDVVSRVQVLHQIHLSLNQLSLSRIRKK